MKQVVILGAGGHARVVADIVRACGDEVIAFLDDNKTLHGISGAISEYRRFDGCEFVMGIGSAAVREKLSALPVTWYTAIHPSAVISERATVGEGTVIMPNAVITTGARIGRHCIVNTAAVVEHDDIVEDFAHISVGAKLGGNVRVGKSAWIGIGATVSNNVVICAGCTVGAGAVAVDNLTEAGTYFGVPAKRKE